ncbi:hypothetical protein BSKO_14138 [Bryopsis sp. KO-2023]|nr:hypothetical protein BSKO_14138 [Bryopsis sp. KO-2023]
MWGSGGSVGHPSGLYEIGELSCGGQLGLGDDYDRLEPTKVKNDWAEKGTASAFAKISCGFNHTAALELGLLSGRFPVWEVAFRVLVDRNGTLCESPPKRQCPGNCRSSALSRFTFIILKDYGHCSKTKGQSQACEYEQFASLQASEEEQDAQ